ncbi:MAG: integrase arm-type DNA-binding domain-containing protein, partial [Pseudolabrys sp.]
MAKPGEGSTITKATVEAALRDATRGVQWEHPDPACPGLSLRARGRITWSFRGPRLGGRNRRWTLGDHTVSPDEARDRAARVRRLIKQGFNPGPALTEMQTGLR